MSVAPIRNSKASPARAAAAQTPHITNRTRRSYVAVTFRQLSRGGYKSALGWADRSGLKREKPEYTSDYVAVVVRAMPKTVLKVGEFVKVELADLMSIRDGVAHISVTPEIQALCEVQYSGGLAPVGTHVPTYVILRLRAPLEKGQVLPPILYVSSYK